MGRQSWSRWAAWLAIVALIGWCGPALADQGASQTAPATPTGIPNDSSLSAWNQAATSQSDQIGVIPQPTLAAPGLVTGITLGELYTNNLTLAPSGKPKQSDLITSIQPFLKSAYSAPRFSGLLDYSVTGYLYHQHSKDNQLSQNLNAMGTLTLLPQHFFLDGTALYGQQIINNAAPAGSGTFFLTNNRANAATEVLSPYWIQDFGSAGLATLRYSHGRVVYNVHGGIPGESSATLSGIPDVTSNSLQFSLVSPIGVTWGWNLSYSDQRLEPDFGTGVQYAVAKLGTSLQVTPDTQLLADIGKENKFLPNGTVQKLGAGFWDAGFEWANTLDDLKMLIGHRFYGRSYQLSWTHIAALLTTNLSYTENPTDINQQLLGQNPGELINSPSGTLWIPSLTERQVYLSKRAMASATYVTAKSMLSVTLYDELRTYFILNSSQERIANADISWLFDIGVFTTLTPTFGWQRYQFQSGQINYNTYEQLALIHQFSAENTGSIKLRSDSSNVYAGAPGAHGYRVYVIYVQWTHLF